jgi:MFS family permease
VVFGAMAAQMGMGMVYARGPLTPPMVEELGFARGDLMLAMSPATWVTALASPVAGLLTQRYGARPVVIFGICWLALLYIGFSQVENLWQLFALSIGSGVLVASLGDVAVGTVVAHWVSAGRGFALGIVYSGSNFGGLLGAAAAGFLLVQVGWRMAFAVVGIGASALLLPWVLASVREPPAGYAPPSEAGEDSASSAGEPALELRQALRTREFWFLSVALFCFYLYFMGVNAHLTLYLTDLGLSRLDVALNYAMMVGVGVLAKLSIGMVADRWQAKASLLLCFALVLLASGLLLGIAASPELAPVFMVTHGFATMAQNVVYPAAVAWCFGTRYMAEIYGVIMLALFPAGILAPIALGYLHDAVGSYDLAFQGLFAVNFVGLLLAWRVRSARAL